MLAPFLFLSTPRIRNACYFRHLVCCGHTGSDVPNNAYPFFFQDRVMDLISRMTFSEKIANRYDMESEVDPLGLPT